MAESSAQLMLIMAAFKVLHALLREDMPLDLATMMTKGNLEYAVLFLAFHLVFPLTR